jgi:phosphoribosyl 1,2-cyclic phosphodiesterase
MSLHIQVLGSTSSGNCTLVWDEHHTVMIDCGFSTRHTTACLNALDVTLPPFAGVLITHAHIDHAGGSMLAALIGQGVPLLCHDRVLPEICRRYDPCREAAMRKLLHTFDETSFPLGKFTVKPFEVPHDSPGGCFGFNIFKPHGSSLRKISIATDIGHVDDACADHFLDSEALVIESNHDVPMLEKSGRPAWLINRIKKAHLANQQCAELVGRVAARSQVPLQAVVLAHLSKECNTHALAAECTRSLLDNRGYSAVAVHLTHESRPGERVSLG